MAGSRLFGHCPNALRKLEAVDGEIEREMGRVQSHEDVFAARSNVWGNLEPGESLSTDILASPSAHNRHVWQSVVHVVP